MKKKDLKKIYHNSFIGLVLLSILIAVLPIVTPSAYFLTVFIMIGIYALACNGLTLLIGYAGQISLGHAAFYGIGAYSSAIITSTYGLSPWLGMTVGMALSAIIALFVGIPTFKLKGHYLALATLGFGIIVFTLFKEFDGLTGGSNGFFGIPSINFLGFQINSDLRYFYLVWFLVLICSIFSRNIINSRIGRALRSIEGSEIASDAVGVNTLNYKLQVFVLSAMFTSLAGSLLAHYVSFINPNLFGAMTSIYFLIIVIIGGSYSIWGSIIGAAFYVLLGELLKQFTSGEFEIVFFGILLVVMLIYMPNGLSPQFEKIFIKFQKKQMTIKNPLQVNKNHIASEGDNQ